MLAALGKKLPGSPMTVQPLHESSPDRGPSPSCSTGSSGGALSAEQSECHLSAELQAVQLLIGGGGPFDRWSSVLQSW